MSTSSSTIPEHLQSFLEALNRNRVDSAEGDPTKSSFQGMDMKEVEDLLDVTTMQSLPSDLKQAMDTLVSASIDALEKRFSDLLGSHQSFPHTGQEKATKAVACLLLCFTPDT